MFELPTNNAVQIREDVVNRLVETIFKKRELFYCDEYVAMDGELELAGRHSSPRKEGDTRKFVAFSMEERKKAFDIFKEKGYHIGKETWYSPRGSALYCYVLRERKDVEEDRQFCWIF